MQQDFLETFRTSTLMVFQQEKENRESHSFRSDDPHLKKQRLCLHKWFSLTKLCKVCTLCEKVIIG